MTVKIKTNQTIQKWFTEQSKQAAVLYNLCLDAQFGLANLGKSCLQPLIWQHIFELFPLGLITKIEFLSVWLTAQKNGFPVNPCAMKCIGKALKKKK